MPKRPPGRPPGGPRRGPGRGPGGPRRRRRGPHGPPPHGRRFRDRFEDDHPDRDHPLESDHPDAVNDPRYEVPPDDLFTRNPRGAAQRLNLPRTCPSCSAPVDPDDVPAAKPACPFCGVMLVTG